MKPFLSYEQQIEKLKIEKELIIENEEFAKSKLKEVGYYHLITGYKDLFRNKAVRKYKHGVCFEDIYVLYEFDKTLREVFFKYLQIIELTFASHISYYFCEKYDSHQEKYLDVSSYTNSAKKRNRVNTLIRMLNELANETKLYNNILYNRNHYHNVPLWITINHLTFGSKSKMFELLQAPMQERISKEYNGLSISALSKTMKFLTKFRNICAHGNRLYNYKSNEDLPNMKIHERLEIPKIGVQYIYGKKDLFGVVIAFRYLLSKEDFKRFIGELEKAISSYTKSSSYLSENEIFKEMGFPVNWKNISLF